MKVRCFGKKGTSSIKPSTYEAMPFLSESIDIKMIFYEKKRDGVVFEIQEDE